MGISSLYQHIEDPEWFSLKVVAVNKSAFDGHEMKEGQFRIEFKSQHDRGEIVIFFPLTMRRVFLAMANSAKQAIETEPLDTRFSVTILDCEEKQGNHHDH